ncbi:flagellin [Desulfallas thermosapovorans]|uniref:Flagellin n=1 Tax=Desulfallas thermosapovorans DSM 6562 TaxID=1121431 RepID=A0A5S4ZTK4_9FIRM|nr:flagellin [Desulfallas thermosapovorans]TYO95523.1 flagellin [Desulfallas thermosapovorans DSM 6562]
MLALMHNIPAINTYRNKNLATTKVVKTIEKLSSGLRINKAADDAAGLAISQKMRAQIRGLDRAQRNVQDGISLIQTAEGGLNNILEPPLHRLRQLAVQAANGILSKQDIEKIQLEIDEIKKEINNIANNTHFNSITLLDGSLSGFSTITRSIIVGSKEITPAASASVSGNADLSGGLTITKDVNDTLTFKVDGVGMSITLDAGTYTLTNLLTEINSKLSSINSGVTASYQNSKLVLTVNEAGNHTISDIAGNAVTSLFINKVLGDITDLYAFGWTDVYPSVTIEEGVNDTLTFTADGVDYSLKLAPGTYSTITTGDASKSPLAAALDDAANKAGAPVYTRIWGVHGDPDDPRRVIEFIKKGIIGPQAIGNFGGNAKETLFARMNPDRNFGVDGIDSSNMIEGEGTYTETKITGSVDLSAGLIVTAGQNDSLILTVDGMLKSINLTPGDYNQAGLLAEINDKLLTAGAGITASYENDKLVLTHAAAGDIEIIAGNAINSLFIPKINGTNAVIENIYGTIEEMVQDPGKVVNIQVGSNAGQSFLITISDASTANLGIDDVTVESSETANEAIVKIDNAIRKITSECSRLGAYQNRLEHIINNLGTSTENLTAAESRIRDVDMAREMMEFTKMNILSQSAQAMLAQANQMPQGVLQLLR